MHLMRSIIRLAAPVVGVGVLLATTTRVALAHGTVAPQPTPLSSLTT
jgi:hypothetical protein